MKRLILLIALFVSHGYAQSVGFGGSVTVGGSVNIGSTGTPVTGCGAGYSFSRELVLRSAFNSDLTNYPLLLDGSMIASSLQTALKTSANGGEVQNTANNSIGVSGPADVVFCDASSGGNALKYEFETYSASTAGGWKIWVEIPTYHAASSDSIWIFANKSSVVTSQQDLTMWGDINAELVCHFPDGSSLNTTCSKQKASLTNTSVTATTGVIDGGASFSSANLNAGDHYSETGNYSVQAWVYKNPCTADFQPIATNYDGTSGWWFYLCDGGGNRLSFNTPGGQKTSIGLQIPYSKWTNVAGTYATSGTVGKIFENGVDITVSNGSGLASTSTANLKIGNTAGSGSFVAYDGKMDELRIFASTLSPDWQLTDSYSQDFLSPLYMDWFASTYAVNEPSYSAPTIRQFTKCNTDKFSGTCPMLPVVSGNHYVIVMAVTDELSPSCGTHLPTDSKGLTFTCHVGDSFTGTIHSYQEYIITAPITSSGADTIALPTSGVGGPNVAAVVYEVAKITTSGVVTTDAGNTAGPPSSMSATSPGPNSLLICGTRNSAPGGTYVVPTTSEGYDAYQSGLNGTDHGSAAYAAYAVVGTGTKTCTLDSGNGAVMAIFPYAP
jgi:hypothetical protein